MNTSMPLPPEIAAHTSTGRVRSSNEDAFGFCAEHGICVVCDGMGGAAGGEIASRMVVDSLLRRLCAEQTALPERESLQQAVSDANHAVLEHAEQNPGLHGMGTTLVALLLRPAEALIAHAGDSRCYLLRDGQLERCTHDHSLVDEQIRLGMMTQEEAARSPLRSVITRAIGTQPAVTADMREMDARPGDLFLLCTDGLTREISEPHIAQILTASVSLDAAAEDLVNAANQAGGHDNITCVLVRIP